MSPTKQKWQELESQEANKSFKNPDSVRNFADNQKPVFIFRNFGDQIEGQLLQASSQYRRFQCKTFFIEVLSQAGQYNTFRIIANKQIQKAVEKHELIGKFVKIRYVNAQRTNFGHKKKIYRIWLQKGVFSNKESEVTK